MVVFGLTVAFTVIYAEVDGVIVAIFTVDVDQVHNTDTTQQSVYGTAILPVYKFDGPGLFMALLAR